MGAVEVTGFVAELRSASMKLHSREQSREGEKDAKKPEEKAIHKWEPTMEGYMRFLVDSKVLFETLEGIIHKAALPSYAEFQNNGQERSEALAKDLEWFKGQGHTVPKPSTAGVSYASYLEELLEKDLQAFICHFYTVYFGHNAGGRIIGKRVAEKLLNKKQLEFYKWAGDLPQLLQNVKEKLNKVAEGWSREEKNHCLEEIETSFKYYGAILRLVVLT